MTRSLIPNSTQVPDIILDEWLPHLSGAELAIVLVVARKTFGWGKSYDRIGTVQMSELTGLKRRAIQMACDSLEAVGALAIRVAGDGITSNAYKLNMAAPDSVLAALIVRTETAEAKHAEVMGKPTETAGGGAKNAPGAKNALVQKKTLGGAKNAPEGAQKMRPSRDTIRNTSQETEDKTPVYHKNDIPPPVGAVCKVSIKSEVPQKVEAEFSAKPEVVHLSNSRTRGRPTPCAIPTREEVQAYFDSQGHSALMDGFYLMEEQRGWTQGKQQLPLVNWQAAARRYILDPEGIRIKPQQGYKNGSSSNGSATHADAKQQSGWAKQIAADLAQRAAQA